MKKVFVQGAFEIINAGHIKVFEFCRRAGDFLIVGLNTNELLREYKKREPVFPFEEKKLLIESIRFVDLVVPAPEFSPLALIKSFDIDVYCIGHEWRESKSVEIDFMRFRSKEVIYIPDFGLTRTSTVKQRLLQEAAQRG